jgi:hypothetical protein
MSAEWVPAEEYTVAVVLMLDNAGVYGQCIGCLENRLVAVMD